MSGPWMIDRFQLARFHFQNPALVSIYEKNAHWLMMAQVHDLIRAIGDCKMRAATEAMQVPMTRFPKSKVSGRYIDVSFPRKGEL